MNAILFSDVHLIDGTSVKTQLVIRFMQEVASRFERIYILGDLFDVWPGTNSYLIQKYQPVLSVIEQWVKEGRQVCYIEGNHDFKLGDHFIKKLGVKVVQNEIQETWNDRKVYLAHGDLGNPRDWSYKALRYLLRHPGLHGLMKFVPGKWVYDVGRRTSKASRGLQDKYTFTKEKEAMIRQIYRNTAEGLFEKGYDIVVMGHTHLPDDYRKKVNDRECRYFNTGDWIKNFTYLEFDGKDFYTRTHPIKEQ